jgi:hypothetical protein
MRSKFFHQGYAAFQRGLTNNPHTNGDCDSAETEWEQGYDMAEQECLDKEYVTHVRSRNAQQVYE